MGNAQSPAANPRFAAATRSFGKQELDDLRSLFVSLASQSQSNGEFISPSIFQEYFGIPGPLGSRLFQLFSQKRNDGKLTYEDLVISKAVYEKGIPNEIEEFLYELCDTDGDGMVGRVVASVAVSSCLTKGANVKLNMTSICNLWRIHNCCDTKSISNTGLKAIHHLHDRGKSGSTIFIGFSQLHHTLTGTLSYSVPSYPPRTTSCEEEKEFSR